MQCQICREETSDFNESTYVSRHYLKRATGQIPERGVQRQLLLPVPSIILAGSPPVSDYAAGSTLRKIQEK